MIISISIALAIVAFASLIFYSRQKHQYWAVRGIWSPKCLPILGHILDLYIKKSRWEYMDKIYCNYKDKKYWGMYTGNTPSIIITDPDLIKLILVKDANYFVDRPNFDIGGKDRIFNEFLTVLCGEKWKALRSIISPTFTSGKIKATMPLISESVENLLKNCQLKMEQDGFVEMKTMSGYYSMDVITTCAFGMEVNSFSNRNSEFVKACYQAANPTAGDILKIFLFLMNQKLFYAFGFSISGKSLHYLEKCVLQTVKIRQETNTKRGDFLDHMLEALKAHEESTAITDKKYHMSMATIVSSSILFILAGYDTTSSAMSFVFYLLAKNTNCQEQLRSELQELQETNGEINYQNLMEAKYLDACIYETLRMYGPAHVLDRVSTQDYKVPSHDLTIPKDMTVSIPSWSLQYDPDHWDDPRKFEPERFLPENRQNINQYAFLGFGHGPRNCVGMRFALLEMKMAISQMVLRFKINLKPGFELKLATKPNTIQPNSDGIQITFQQLKS